MIEPNQRDGPFFFFFSRDRAFFQKLFRYSQFNRMVGFDVLVYFQGWTESGTASKGVTELAVMMDMTETQLLNKYRIYQEALPNRQAVGNQGKTNLQAKLGNKKFGSKNTNSETTKKRKASMVTPMKETPFKKKKGCRKRKHKHGMEPWQRE